MANTYSDNLRLIIQTAGENAGTWGGYTNTNFGTLVEQAITGVATIAVSGSTNHTLTVADGASDQSRNMGLIISGTLTAAINITCPTVPKVYVIRNSTTGGFAVTLKTSAGTGVSVPNGRTMFLMCDGTNVVATLNYYAGPIGATAPSTGDFTIMTATSGAFGALTGPIGATTPAAGTFTGINGPIGATTPNTGAFTVLTADSAVLDVFSGPPAGVSDQANTSTGYFGVSAGTTAQRPASPAAGQVRYNTTDSVYEAYSTAWGAVPIGFPWKVFGVPVVYVSTRSFKIASATNYTSFFQVGQRIRANTTAGVRYATVIISSFSTVPDPDETTITVAFQNSTDALDSGITGTGTISVGYEPASNPAILQASGSMLDLTGYTGADIPLQVGQTATYALSAAPFLTLRIACAPDQHYTITINPDFYSYTGTSTAFANTILFMNGVDVATSTSWIQAQPTAWPGGVTTVTTQNFSGLSFLLDASSGMMEINARVCTRTLNKTVISTYASILASTVHTSGTLSSKCNTGDVWTSLGGIGFTTNITARVSVRRDY